MFSDYDALIREALEAPNEIWEKLDSFWRDRTDASTEELIHYQTWASLTLALNTHARALHFLSTQTVPEVTQFLKQPWYPVVIFQDRLVDNSFYLYGEPGLIYDTPAQILYGEVSTTSRTLYPLPVDQVRICDVPELVDSITASRVVLDKSQFSYDPVSGQLTFLVDPFDLIPAKTTTDSRDYIVLWIRNASIDLDVPFDQVGWVVKYDENSIASYVDGLKRIWELVLLGPSMGRYREGLTVAMGFPVARRDATITRIENDTYQLVISTDQDTYSAAPVAQINPVVSIGQFVPRGTPLTDGVLFAEYPDTLSLTPAQLSGLLLRVPLSTGIVASLTFANIATDWTYDVARPSPWRFPVGGDPAEVEQFWVDIDSFATANSIDFQVIYGLVIMGVNPVNPMHRVIEDLMHNNLVIGSVRLADMPRDPGGFHDRARLLLPTDILLVLHQILGDISDSYDLGTETSDTVGYGYNADVPTEVISIPGSGSDLTYFDYTPLVVIS